MGFLSQSAPAFSYGLLVLGVAFGAAVVLVVRYVRGLKRELHEVKAYVVHRDEADRLAHSGTEGASSGVVVPFPRSPRRSRAVRQGRRLGRAMAGEVRARPFSYAVALTAFAAVILASLWAASPGVSRNHSTDHDAAPRSPGKGSGASPIPIAPMTHDLAEGLDRGQDISERTTLPRRTEPTPRHRRPADVEADEPARHKAPEAEVVRLTPVEETPKGDGLVEVDVALAVRL